MPAVCSFRVRSDSHRMGATLGATGTSNRLTARSYMDNARQLGRGHRPI
jgi:hypothetical protein